MITTALWKGTIPDTTQHRVYWLLPDARAKITGNKDTSGDGEQDRLIDNEKEGIKNEEVDYLRIDCGNESDEERHKNRKQQDGNRHHR